MAVAKDYHKLVSTTETGDLKSVITVIKVEDSEFTAMVVLSLKGSELLNRSFTSNKEERVAAFIEAMSIECNELLKERAGPN